MQLSEPECRSQQSVWSVFSTHALVHELMDTINSRCMAYKLQRAAMHAGKRSRNITGALCACTHPDLCVFGTIQGLYNPYVTLVNSFELERRYVLSKA